MNGEAKGGGMFLLNVVFQEQTVNFQCYVQELVEIS